MTNTIDLSQLKCIKEELWDMPMFHMMLGGRELFHSNFLGWIFEKHTAAFCKYFGLNADRVHIQREKFNLDLTVSYRNQHLFIENKFKAIVNEDQLGRYKAKISEKSEFRKAIKNFIVISPDEFDFVQRTVDELQQFMPYHWQVTGNHWHHLSYVKLLEHLRKIDDPYIKDYIRMTEMALKFMECAMDNDCKYKRTYWFDPEAQFSDQDGIARELRLQDMLQKRRAEILRQALWQRCQGQHLSVNKKDVRSDFTRTEPLAEVFIHLDEHLSMGIQVQGHAYKRCLLINREAASKKGGYTNQTAKHLKNKAGELRKSGWFTSKDRGTFSGGALEGRSTHTKKSDNFGRYHDNFLYEYVRVGAGGLSPQNILDSVVADIMFARHLLN